MNKFTKRLSVAMIAIGAVVPTAIADQVVNDDFIVKSSLCVGLDCVDGENFNFDTIRLKENNTRIRFVDSSSTSTFPSNDWQLTANDSVNGGANKFSIEDISGVKVPFTIIAGAPNDSIYVTATGNVGINTSAPLVQMHMKDGNSPALRLEQDGSSGFAAQSWDIGGNETNFFIRDITYGSRIPFKIKPSAPNDSIYVASDGDIGFETSTPDGQFDVAHYNNANDHAFLISPVSNVGVNIANGNVPLGLFDVNTAVGKSGFLVKSDGNVGFGTGSSAVVGRFDVRSLDNTQYYLNVDATGDIGIGTSTPVGRFEITPVAGGSAHFAVDAAGNVGVGTNTPTANFDITAPDATMLIKDTTVPAAMELRTLLKLQTHYGNQIQFTVDNNAGKDWFVGTGKNGGSFQFNRQDSTATSNFALGNGAMTLTKVDNAQIMKVTDGSFLVSDSNGTNLINATATNMTVSGTFNSGSSRTIKDNIVNVNPSDILNALSNLTIKKWNYIADGDGVQHIGPIAEDFYSLFGLGIDEKHIASLDTSGVALAAIQALNDDLKEKNEQIRKLKKQNNQLNDRVEAIEIKLKKLLLK